MRILLLSCLFIATLSSCFEIQEQVKMEKDGSGLLTLVVDISESSSTLKTYMETAKLTGQNIPTQENINAMISMLENGLKTTDGMSNVQSSRDFDKYVFKIQGNFRDVETLNTVMNKVTTDFTRGTLKGKEFNNFANTSNTFSRLFQYPLDKFNYDNIPYMYQYIFESARFTNSYSFPSPIAEYSNSTAVLSEDKKEIQLQQTLADILKGKGSLANEIIF